jgi:hypothetical protein
MSRKWLITLVFIGIFFLGCSVLVWAITPIPAAAQCGSNPPPDSSCYTCHVQEDPVSGNGEWHGIHANKDCCAKCHGGNCSTMDKDLAHQGMITNPLSDIYTNCHSCHPDDYQVRAEVFAVELDITPSSITTPTPAPAGKVLASPLVILPSPVVATPSTFPWLAILGSLPIIVLFLFGLITLITHLRA